MNSVADDCRKARGLRPFDNLQQDLRYAFRLLRRTPGFTTTALATLAICLGANLAIFAVVDAVLLRPLPFPDARRLVRVFNTYPMAGVPDDGANLTNYYERRGSIRAFTSLALYRDGTAIVGDRGATERVDVTRVSSEFFATLGQQPVQGRTFTEAETTFQTDGVAILTDVFWRQRLNADPAAIGRTIRVDGRERTIVGILPPSFSFLSSQARLYFPFSSDPVQHAPQRRHWGSSSQMIPRLAPQATVAAAQSEVDAHNAAVETNSPEAPMMAAAGFRSLVVPLHADHVAAVRPVLLLVQAGARCLLLIGAVNLANLLLIRAAGRVKEFAVRQALGASRGDVVREVLVETTVLTLLGGCVGLVAGAAGIRVLETLGTDRLPLGAHIAFDARIAAVALGAAVFIGIAIGRPIAWYTLRNHVGALKAESRASTAGRTAQRMRHGFLVAQVAMAFVLLAGAGLLAVSLSNVMALPSGFHPEHVLSGRLSLPGATYQTGASRLALTERLISAVRGQPGVLAAGIASNVPLSGNTAKSAASIQGRTLKPGEAPRGIYSYGVGGDYFSAMGIPLREGRFLTTDDSHRADRVCVVDEHFARRSWPSGRALGQRLFSGTSQGSAAEAFTVVGVVGAVKQAALTDEDTQGAVFYPYGYRPDGDLFLVARTTLASETLGGAIQRAVRSVEPEMPVTDLRSMEARVADSLATRRSPAVLAGLFAGIALLLTAIGTYGVLSFAVAERQREIGLRMALGAQPRQIRNQFVALALRLVAAGTGLGLVGAWLTGQAMRMILFRVPALHLTTLAATAVTLGLVSLVACLLPSRRAAHVSPMDVLNGS